MIFLEASFLFSLVHHTLTIQPSQWKGPITDGLANSPVTCEALCSDIDIPIENTEAGRGEMYCCVNRAILRRLQGRKEIYELPLIT